MSLNCRDVQFTPFPRPSPDQRIACEFEARSARASGRRKARLELANLLLVLTTLALMPVLCKVGLAAPGVSLTVTVSSSSLAFGYVAIGSTSAARNVTLRNASNTALTIQGIAIMGSNSTDFAQNNNCGNSVAVGASCTFSVTLTPSVAGTRSATLVISYIGPDSPQSVVLMGIGVVVAVSLSPASLSFGSGVADKALRTRRSGE